MEIERIRQLFPQISAPPEGKKITKISFSYDAQGNITEIKFYSNIELLFKLKLSYDSQGNLSSVERIE